ncbi:hypothetical protein, partial [Leptospira borgpetersenii]|uniref:hypothetical protein n=1 Tax=Leptospira borgpetersenii TaxID=174 RepID=UPI001D140507
ERLLGRAGRALDFNRTLAHTETPSSGRPRPTACCTTASHNATISTNSTIPQNIPDNTPQIGDTQDHILALGLQKLSRSFL